MPQDSEVLWTEIFAHATVIFVKSAIQHPVNAIFHAPMSRHRPCKSLCRTCHTHDGVACFPGDLLTDPPRRAHHATTAQAFPTLLGIQIRDVCRITNGPGLPNLEPAIPSSSPHSPWGFPSFLTSSFRCDCPEISPAKP